MDCTYELGVTRSFVEAMCSKILQKMVEKEIGCSLISQICSFPKISGRSVPFPRRKGIRQWSSAACKMRDTAGATSSAISFSNPAGTLSGHVALWDLRARLRSSLVTPKVLTTISSIGKWRLSARSREFIGLPLENTETYWFVPSFHNCRILKTPFFMLKSIIVVLIVKCWPSYHLHLQNSCYLTFLFRICIPYILMGACGLSSQC